MLCADSQSRALWGRLSTVWGGGERERGVTRIKVTQSLETSILKHQGSSKIKKPARPVLHLAHKCPTLMTPIIVINGIC